MSKQHPFLLQKILRFPQLLAYIIHNWKIKSISFDSGCILGPFCSCVLLCQASVVLGKQFCWRMVIQRLLLCRVLSKGSKVSLCNVYLAAFEYFRSGITHFDRPIRIKHFTPCTRVLDRQPWVQGCPILSSKGFMDESRG